MKRLFAGLALAFCAALSSAATLNPIQLLNPTGSSSGQTIVSTGSSSAPAWGGVGLNGIAAIGANTVLANNTASSANPVAVSIPTTCNNTSSALQWAAGVGFACNATINAAALGGATFAAPTAIGSTTPASGAFTTLNASGNDALLYQTTAGQSIPNSTATTLTTFTKVSDRVNANFNATTGTFTAPATGYYQVSGAFTFSTAAGVSGAVYSASVVANGVTVATGRFDQTATTSTAVQVQIPYTVVSLTAGQTIIIQVNQSTGVARTMSTAGALNFVSISRLP